MIVCGLRQSGVPDGEVLAGQLATRWIQANYQGYQATGHMHEKYNARDPGVVGGGGEYVPQVGFGWSNGVLLDFLWMYPDQSTLRT
jgi:alpha,alpha-trehalase